MEKNNKQKSNTNGISPVNRFNIAFVNIQVIFTILTIILAIAYLFNRKMQFYFELSLVANLFIMAFNNQIIYKRARMTIIYLLVAILLFVCMVI